MYQLKLGASKEGLCSKLSLGSYTRTIFILTATVQSVLDTHKLHSFRLVVCCEAVCFLLSVGAGFRLATPLVSTSPLCHQNHSSSPTTLLSVTQSPLDASFRLWGAYGQLILWPKASLNLLY